MIPSVCPRPSSARSRRIASARSIHALRVSLPWMLLASAQRCRPSGVLGLVDLPPWEAHLLAVLWLGFVLPRSILLSFLD